VSTALRGLASMAASIQRLSISELRRLWPWAVAIVALELLRIPVDEVGVRRPWEVEHLPWLLDALTIATIWLVTATIVQADHPNDDSAFWRTRPIDPVVFAAGKIVTVAVLVAGLPGLVHGGRLLSDGAPISSALVATWQIGVQAGAHVLPAWIVALLARTLPRFVAVGAGVVVIGAFSLISVLNGLYALGLNPTEGALERFIIDGWQMHGSYGWVPAGAATAAALAVVCSYYRTRRAWRTVGALLILLVGIRVWPAIDAGPPAVAPALADAAHRVVLESTFVHVRRKGWRGPTLEARFDLPALPAEYSASLRLRDVTIRTSSGATLSVPERILCCAGLGVRGVLQPAPAGTIPRRFADGALIDLPGPEADALAGQRVSVAGRGTVDLWRHREVGSMPLAAGARLLTDRYRLDIIEPKYYDEPSPGHSVGLIMRLARYPGWTSESDLDLRFLLATPDRTRVIRLRSTREEIESVETQPEAFFWPSSGRSWTFRVPLWQYATSAFPSFHGTQILVFETVPAGRAWTSVTARDVPLPRLESVD
jgi:hypothetical protein